MRPAAWPSSAIPQPSSRSEEHTSELQSHVNIVCRLLLEKKNKSISQGSAGHDACRHAFHSWKSSYEATTCLRYGFHCSLLVSNFFFNDTPTTEIYTLSLHDALPI